MMAPVVLFPVVIIHYLRVYSTTLGIAKVECENKTETESSNPPFVASIYPIHSPCLVPPALVLHDSNVAADQETAEKCATQDGQEVAHIH